MNKIKGMKILLIICIMMSILMLSGSKAYAAFTFRDMSIFESLTSDKTNMSMTRRLIEVLKKLKEFQSDSNNSSEENEVLKTPEDTDGDGLLDNVAQYVNGQMVAPIDPDPLVANAPAGIWQKQVQIEKEGNIPYYLTDFYVYDGNTLKQNGIDWRKLRQNENSLNSKYLLEIVSNILNFRLDNGREVLHSQTSEEIYEYIMEEAKENLSTIEYLQFKIAAKYLGLENHTETWQKKYGYNDLYDKVFRIATNNNMRSAKFYFQDNNNDEYVLWIWRGDYLTLGSGAEMGLYKKNIYIDNNTEHWDAVDFEVPMTLNLYNYNSANDIEQIFSWKPENTQWWITGFNPNYSDIDVEKQVLTGTIDFSEHTDMYESLKENIGENKGNEKYIIFDDVNYKLWISFYT